MRLTKIQPWPPKLWLIIISSSMHLATYIERTEESYRCARCSGYLEVTDPSVSFATAADFIHSQVTCLHACKSNCKQKILLHEQMFWCLTLKVSFIYMPNRCYSLPLHFDCLVDDYAELLCTCPTWNSSRIVFISCRLCVSFYSWCIYFHAAEVALRPSQCLFTHAAKCNMCEHWNYCQCVSFTML